jgi:uncharacterized protein (TIGR02186 family)
MTRGRNVPLAGLALQLLLLFLLCPPSANAQLVAALSNHLVAVTTGFSGSDVLLFGAVEGGGDVIVVVRGPEAIATVHRKGRNFGIWMNEAEIAFAGVPEFWAMAATRPVDTLLRDDTAAFYQIGLAHLRLDPIQDANPRRVGEFRDALIRNKVRVGLYTADPGQIVFLGNRLFRTDLRIPANAPIGTYTVSVYLIRDGDVIGAETTPLLVGKVGFEARVFEFAHGQSLAYGILAVLIAAVAGWLANLMFRKG